MLERIRAQVRNDEVRLTQHALQEMAEEQVSLDEVLEVVSHGQVLENYPQHRRGACCLICGSTRSGRVLHVVCTTALPILVIITVYEPTSPKWVTPWQRGQAT